MDRALEYWALRRYKIGPALAASASDLLHLKKIWGYSLSFDPLLTDYIVSQQTNFVIKTLDPIIEKFPSPEKFTLLEVGCGPGFKAEVFARRWPIRVFGCDVSNDALELARNQSHGVQYFQHDLNNALPPSMKFDAIVCVMVLQHNADKDKIIGHLREALNEGGALIIVEECRAPGRFSFQRNRSFWHITENDFRRRLEGNGFSFVSKEALFPRPFLFSMGIFSSKRYSKYKVIEKEFVPDGIYTKFLRRLVQGYIESAKNFSESSRGAISRWLRPADTFGFYARRKP